MQEWPLMTDLPCRPGGGEQPLRKGEAYVGLDTVMRYSSPATRVLAVIHANVTRVGARLDGRRRGSQHGGEGREEGDESETHFGAVPVFRGCFFFFWLEEASRLGYRGDGRFGVNKTSKLKS